MKITDAYVIEGPLYKGPMTEDGEDTYYFDYYVEVKYVNSSVHTYIESFGSKSKAQDLVDELLAKGSVLSPLFIEGGVWDMYKEPMSYEEERNYYGEW
jgi:hypothetical protein